MIIYHGANKQNQNLNKAKINLLYMINYRFLNTLYYLPLTLKQEKSEENKVIKLNNRSKNKKRWYKNIKISFYTTLLSTP